MDSEVSNVMSLVRKSLRCLQFDAIYCMFIYYCKRRNLCAKSDKNQGLWLGLVLVVWYCGADSDQ